MVVELEAKECFPACSGLMVEVWKCETVERGHYTTQLECLQGRQKLGFKLYVCLHACARFMEF